ncbi:MAG TPA: hypothetical protein VHS99_26895, partial [Chloroflexota bacterium]|nr:hypothetical protein [Chloroflexota bacterium]
MSTRKLGKRSVIGLLGATLGTALGPACGHTPGASGATAPSSPRRAIGGTSAPLNAPAERLYLATQTGLSVVDAGSGKLDFAVPGAVPSPEGSRFVTCTHEGDTTHLRLIDAVDGSVRGAVSLHGRLSARVVSPRATRVALVEQDSAGPNPWTPAGRERTTLVVADPSGETPPRSYELEGNYEPEAFAADLRGLFVIQHLPALAPDRYRVRRFDLARGIPGPILTVKLTEVATEEEMRGKGRMQVFAPRLTTLYTLYTRQDDHLHTRDSIAAGGTGRPNPDVHAFVHVLNLEQGWAYCLDLPAPFGTGPSQSHAIGVAPNGRRLFVADCSTGWMATADPTSLQVGHVTRVREVAGAP